MAEDRNNEISELLDKLREKTVAEAVPEKQKKSSKNQNMTDEDVKNLLRRYFDDIEPAEGEAASAEKNDEPINLYGLDTSDFVTADEAEPEPDTIEEDTNEPEVEIELDKPLVEVTAAQEEPADEPFEDNEPLTAEDIEEITEGDVTAEAFAFDEPELIEELPAEEEIAEEELDEDILDGEDELLELDELISIESEEIPEELYDTDSFIDEEPERPEEECVAEDDIIYDYVHREPENLTIDELYDEPDDEPELDEHSSADEPVIGEDQVETGEPEFDPEDAPIPTLDDDEPYEPEPVSDINYDNVKDVDIDVMVALGFGDKIKEKFGDERIMRTARNIKKNTEIVESERAFGYIGEEYTSESQNEDVRASFERDRRRLIARLCVTGIMSLLLLIYENLQIFGITLGGIFDMNKYPAAYIMISLQLLVLCAVPSWKNLYDGVLGAINQKLTARTLLAAALATMALYDIVMAIISPQGVILFGFPISLGLVFSVLSEYLDYMRERRAFDIISKSGEKYILTDTGITPDGRVILSAEKTRFVSGYFERTGKVEPSTSVMLFSVVPLVAVGVVLCVVSAAMGQGVSAALGIFAGSISFGVPLTQIVALALSEFGIASALRADGSANIGNSVEDEYSDAGVVAMDDELAFPKGTATVTAIKIFESNDIYRTLYNINALYSVAGGPLCHVFAESAASLGAPDSVRLGEYGTDFISADIDGVTVAAGSREAFAIRGIALPKAAEPYDGNAFIYVAADGKVCASIAAKYELGTEFLKVYSSLLHDGISVRIRSLDPAVNEALTEKLGTKEPLSVSKEPLHKATLESADAGIVSGSVFGLIKPLILRRRARSTAKIFTYIRYVETAACTLFCAALMLSSMTVGLSALAGLCQLVCFGIVTVAFLMMRKNNLKH